MKRTVALAILGMTSVAAINAFGQGDIRFNNYATAAPYEPIFYSAELGGGNVGAGQGVIISVFGAPTGGALSEVAIATIGTFAGYTADEVFRITNDAGYNGELWDLQLVASGSVGGTPVTGAGPVITTALAIQGVGVPETPFKVLSPGFEVTAVPEPTTFALAGLGAAALLIFRRRD